jgi:hypothetical protein
MFNDKVFEFLELCKNNSKKLVILIFTPELVKVIQPNGLETNARRIATTGKKWEGKIEKEFSVVLYCDVDVDVGVDVEGGVEDAFGYGDDDAYVVDDVDDGDGVVCGVDDDDGNVDDVDDDDDD